MAYEKRVCVLKQVKKGFSADGSALSGAVYAERLGKELTITPRILGIAPVKDGRYALAVCAEGETALLELRGNAPLKVADFPSIKAGFSVLLVFSRGETEPVAFGACGAAPQGYESLLAAFSKEGKKKKEVPPPPPDPEETPLPFTPNAPVLPPEEEARPFREGACAAYDDEAIAAVDYYGDAGDGDGKALSGGFDGETAQADGAEAQTHGGDGVLRPRGTLTYFNTVREKLEEAFRRFPRDGRLKAVFPQSEWVRAEGALLGIIYEEGIPKFLCVAAEDTGELPPAMKEHGCFVPLSHLSDTVGLFVVFQSADSGEYVTVKDN